jgi:hypothetical protein
MEHHERLENHRVVAYQWNENGKLDRTVYEYQKSDDVENLKKKHKNHDLKIYNYLGHLVHEHKGNGQASVETYA